MRILENIRNREHEQGFSLTEVIVTTALLSIITISSFALTQNMATMQKNMLEEHAGVNQGIVMDEAKKLYGAAGEFQRTWPDVPLTKQSLTDSGLLPQVDGDLKWGVGQSRGTNLKNTGICVVAYSATQQTEKYTIQNPVEISANAVGTGQFAEGCTGYRKDGSWGFTTD